MKCLDHIKMYTLSNINEYQVKININVTNEKLITHERIELTRIRQFIKHNSSLGLGVCTIKLTQTRKRSTNLTTNNQLQNNRAMKNHEQDE